MTMCPATHLAPPPLQPTLPPPVVATARAGVLDPARSKAVITVEPYPLMACGDEIVLFWHGLNNEGDPYRHRVHRFVTELQVGRDMVFVVREPHIAELDGGSLEVYYRITGKHLTSPLLSLPLQLGIGDASPQLLAAVADDAVGGHLDPARVPEGTRITIRPYARMAVGDRLIMIASRDAKALWRDVLDIEAHAVGREVSFWIDPEQMTPHIDHSLTLAYAVRHGRSVRRADSLSLRIGPLPRAALKPPHIVEMNAGALATDDLQHAVTIVIDDATLMAGESVWLQCNGSYSHIEARDVNDETAGQRLPFDVPVAYWQAQRGRSVQVFYEVQRLDDVSQRCEPISVRVD